MIKHNDWPFQGNFEEARTQPAGRAIIGLNDNYEDSNRIFPPIKNDNPHLHVSFDDNGISLDAAKLTAIRQFAEAFKSRGIYVHCLAGRNRSSTICAYLLHLLDNVPIEEACQRIKNGNEHMAVDDKLSAKMRELTGLEIRRP